MSDTRKMPQTVTQDQIGATQAEQDWRNLPDPRPPVSRWLFFFVGIAIILAVAFSGLWYYHKNIVPERLFDRGENYLRDGDYSGAYRLFERVYEVKPKRKDVIFRLGNCLEKMERFDSAANRYLEHLQKLPDDPKALVALGALYIEKLDKADEGFAKLKQGAQKLKNENVWEQVIVFAKQLNKQEEVINALTQKIKLEKAQDALCQDAKRLFSLGAYEQALSGYKKAQKAKDSDEIKASINACLKALGLPDSKEHTIIAGKALGEIEIGDSKKEVKEKMGGASPDKKLFIPFGEKAATDELPAEIWYYNLATAEQFRIIFKDEKVLEIETASNVYKTEAGLCTSNCTDERFADTLEKQDSETATTYKAKKGGLSFYLYKNKKGKLTDKITVRIHKGEKSVFD